MQIEKLDWGKEVKGEVDAADSILAKLNEVIDTVNDLLITHPRLTEKARMRRSFEEENAKHEP